MMERIPGLRRFSRYNTQPSLPHFDNVKVSTYLILGTAAATGLAGAVEIGLNAESMIQGARNAIHRTHHIQTPHLNLEPSNPGLKGSVCPKDGGMEAICDPGKIVVDIHDGQRGRDAASIFSDQHPRIRVVYIKPASHENNSISRYYISGDGIQSREIYVYSGNSNGVDMNGEVSQKIAA